MVDERARKLGLPGQITGTLWRTLRPLGAAGGLLLAVEHSETDKRRTLWLISQRRSGALVSSPLPPHACLAQVHGSGRTAKGAPFLILESLDGELLSERLRSSGTVRVPRAVEVAACLFEALAALHGAGLSHGEISSSTLFVLRGAGAKLLCAAARPGTQRARRDDVARAGAVLFETITGTLPLCDAPTWNGSVAPPAWRAPARLDQALPGIAPELAALMTELLGDDAPPAHLAAARLRRLLVRRPPPSDVNDAPTVAVRYDAPTLVGEPLDGPTLVDAPRAFEHFDGGDDWDDSDEGPTRELPKLRLEAPSSARLASRASPAPPAATAPGASQHDRRTLLIACAVGSFALAATLALAMALLMPPALAKREAPALRAAKTLSAAVPAPSTVAAPAAAPGAPVAATPATTAAPAQRSPRAALPTATRKASPLLHRDADEACVTSLRSELPAAGL